MLSVPAVIAELERLLVRHTPPIPVPLHIVAGAAYYLRLLSDVTPKSRAGNPDTSRKAAKKAATGQGRQHTAILVALDMLGGAGTVEDINVKAGTIKVGWWTADKHRICKRMAELVRLGLAERTGEERDGFGIYRLTRKES